MAPGSDADRHDFVEADGTWCEVRAAPPMPGGPALFLDRDGVVIAEKHYLSDPEAVRLLPGAAEVIGSANRHGIAVVVVTNQAGIGRGFFAWTDFAAVQARLYALLAESRIDMVLACPFHPEGVGRFRHPAHPCRKPRPGMLLRAAQQLGVDLPLFAAG